MDSRMYGIFDQLKRFVDLNDQDVANLHELDALLVPHMAAITDEFYRRLGQFDETRGKIEGRVDQLKKTHHAWMRSMLAGPWDNAYLESRWHIGMVHVREGIDPIWVEAVMDFIRTSTHKVLVTTLPDPQRGSELYTSLCKICDLDSLIINLAYREDRLDRLAEFTGMKRKLIENVIKISR